jgi:hypothetical protein
MTYALLELGQIGWAQCICLGNDWDEIDAGAETLHDFDIQWLEGVAGGTNEVQARMHSQVDLLRPAWLLLLQHVALVLVIQELNDWLPAVPIVHVVAKAWGVDDGQSDLKELLFQLCLGDLNLDSLVNLLGVTAAMVCVVLDGGGEESVDEGGLAQAGLACYHDGEGGAAFGNDLVTLVGKLFEAIVRCCPISW